MTVSDLSERAYVAHILETILSILGLEINSLCIPTIFPGLVSNIHKSKSTIFSGFDPASLAIKFKNEAKCFFAIPITSSSFFSSDFDSSFFSSSSTFGIILSFSSESASTIAVARIGRS